MNKLTIPNGGMPLFGDDFNFLESAQREAFKGIIHEVAATNGGNVILGGCIYSQNLLNWSVTEGFVMIDWEVRFVPAATGPLIGGGTVEIQTDDYFDPAGLKSFQNGSSQNTWAVRRAKFVGLADTGGGIWERGSWKYYGDLLYAVLTAKQTSSSSIQVFNSWQKETANPPQVRRHFNSVQLDGGLVVGNINNSSFTKIAVVPQGFRPAKRFKSIVAAFGSAGYGNVMVELFPNGELYAISTDAITYDLLSLNLHFLVN